MLRRRLIPSLLIDRNQHLVKTTRFSDRIYIGDPRNACVVLSGFNADEILLLDIDATRDKRSVDLGLIKSIAEFSSVPLAVGGGVQTLSQIEMILSLGVERIVLSSILIHDKSFLGSAVRHFGSSSISVVLNHYTYFEGSPMGCFGIKSINKDLSPLLDLANFCCAEGAGEVIIYDVSSDGTRSGFNYDLFAFISCHLPIPTIALGGANTPDDVRQLFHKTEISGASIGSAFVFAPQTKEVLINYPHFKSQVFS